jgi:biotin carboxyl carrier protein
MKMETSITAPVAGTVTRWPVPPSSTAATPSW